MMGRRKLPPYLIILTKKAGYGQQVLTVYD